MSDKNLTCHQKWNEATNVKIREEEDQYELVINFRMYTGSFLIYADISLAQTNF